MERRETSSRTNQKVRERTAEPARLDVWLINDDVTEFHFVVHVLCEVFFKDPSEAGRIAWETHHRGEGLVGTYTYDIAMSKVDKATAMARVGGYPLRFMTRPKEE